ncbi:MAG: flagellar biosynthesis protein FliQ [Thermodesulfobacteriota bacterium]|nr:flagellar biosynthesis protein FliQ [Thermodesulfobacteriota bacterium]
MSPEFITGFIFEALKVAMLLAAPVLLSGLVAGLAVSIFQAATQINEMTLVFIPKMLAVGIAIVVFLPWMLNIIVSFTHDLFINIPNYIR